MTRQTKPKSIEPMRTECTEVSHITHGCIFDDQQVFEIGLGAELKAKAKILHNLKIWLTETSLNTSAAARRLDITKEELKEIKRGKINAIDLGQLIRIAARAGLKPELRLDGGETSNDLTPAPEGEVSGDGR